MMLCEANDRLKSTQLTESQLWEVNSLYILLDLDKDDFCKIVDVVGFEQLAAKRATYDRLIQAEEALTRRERYQAAIQRLEALDDEKAKLEAIVNSYRP